MSCLFTSCVCKIVSRFSSHNLHIVGDYFRFSYGKCKTCHVQCWLILRWCYIFIQLLDSFIILHFTEKFHVFIFLKPKQIFFCRVGVCFAESYSQFYSTKNKNANISHRRFLVLTPFETNFFTFFFFFLLLFTFFTI